MIQILAILLCLIITNQVRQIWNQSTEMSVWSKSWDILTLVISWFSVLHWNFNPGAY